MEGNLHNNVKYIKLTLIGLTTGYCHINRWEENNQKLNY